MSHWHYLLVPPEGETHFNQETLAAALKQAKRSGDSAVQRELREREAYVKPSVRRRRKSLRARARVRKWEKRAAKMAALRLGGAPILPGMGRR